VGELPSTSNHLQINQHNPLRYINLQCITCKKSVLSWFPLRSLTFTF
jgi:hypothetical protein